MLRKEFWLTLAVSFVVCLYIISTPAAATTIIGIGTNSCGSWVEARRDKHSFSYEQWTIAFISGVAVALDAELLKGRDPSGIWVWIDNYCGTHPLDTIGAATGELINILRPGTLTRIR